MRILADGQAGQQAVEGLGHIGVGRLGHLVAVSHRHSPGEGVGGHVEVAEVDSVLRIVSHMRSGGVGLLFPRGIGSGCCDGHTGCESHIY